MAESFLNEVNRAEDILLGALGFGEDASIVSVELTPDGFYRGIGRFGDGETFDFTSDIEADDLERWAIGILAQRAGSPAQSKKRR
ncbi:MAG: hypothetical protein RL417_739 [Pseudomonadota bacterium]|jgi:hypothetical protein